MTLILLAILLDLSRQQGFRVLVALRGGSGSKSGASIHVPDAILLEMSIFLIWMAGRCSIGSNMIPIFAIFRFTLFRVTIGCSGAFSLARWIICKSPVSSESLTEAAFSAIKSFIDRPIKRLLVIEDDAVQAQSIIELIGNGDVESTAVGLGSRGARSAAIDAL